MAKASALVEPHRGELTITGLQAQDGKSSAPSLRFEAGKHGVGDSAPARFGPDVHALHLGEVVEQCDATTPDRATIDTRNEEPDVRLEHGVESQAVTLFRRVLRREKLVELGDEHTDVVGWRRDPLNRNHLHVP